MKKRLQEMEQETMAMHKGDADAAGGKAVEGANRADGAVGAGNGQADGGANASPGHAGAEGFPSAVDEGTAESDARSIYVGNVRKQRTGHPKKRQNAIPLFKENARQTLTKNTPIAKNATNCQQVDYKATGEELNEYFQECGTINRVTIMCHKATGQPKGFAYIEFKDHDSVQNALILNDSVFRGRQLKVVEKRTNVPGLNRGGFARGRPRFARGWRGGYGRRPRGRGRGRGRWAPY